MLRIDHFPKLRNARIARVEDGASLDSNVLEREMAERLNGLSLAKLRVGSVTNEKFKRFVPYFTPFNFSVDTERVRETLRNLEQVDYPCAMHVKSTDELSRHMGIAYQTSFFNYVLGRSDRSSFPALSCGRSSQNVALSLLDFGYTNVAWVYNNEYDHAYVVLPFILTEGKHIGKITRGSIVVDPTCDQLWHKPKQRNAVFLKLDSRLEYKTDWENGADLFPDGVASIDIARRNIGNLYDYSRYHSNGEVFFSAAFRNPVHLS